MAERLGALFMNAAMGPLNYAAQCIVQQRVKEGIHEVAADPLAAAVQRGIETVAQTAGLPASYVTDMLPMAELKQVSARIKQHQEHAMRQWEAHTGPAGGLLGGVADLTLDTRVPDASICFLRLSKKLQLDKELAGPLRQLSDDLVTWQELIVSCRALIDDPSTLEAAYRHRRMVRLGVAITAVLAVAVIAVWLVRVRMARARIDEVLALDDPCTVDQAAEGDVSKASDEQLSAMADRETKCEAGKEAVRQAELERLAEADRVAAAAEKKKLRLERCEKLGKSMATGTPVLSELEEAKPHEAFLRRVAKGALLPKDISDLDKLPCMDTSAAKAIGEPYLRTAVAMAAVWIYNRAPSPTAITLMSKGKGGVTDRDITIFERHVEEMAKRAVLKGEDESLKRTEALCNMKKTLKMRVGQHCRAAATILSGN